MTIRHLLQSAQQQLAAVSDCPVAEAEILLAYALKKSRTNLYTHPDSMPSEAEAVAFANYLKRRMNKEPIAYITEIREFWSLELQVNQATLIPRPETELLVEWVLALDLPQREPIKLADLGTGSGAIALAIAKERPTWQIDATDISDDALQMARKNAQRLALNHIVFRHGNWHAAFSSVQQEAKFDVIVSNPPYIAETEWEEYAAGLAYEPRTALVSGDDGLDAIRVIVDASRDYLKSGGCVMVEHGFRQAPCVREIFLAAGYHEVTTSCDLAGHERATLGRYIF